MKYPILILCALGALTSGLRAQEELFLGVTPAAVGVLDLTSDKFLFYNIGEAEGSRKANITGLVLKTEFQLTTPTDLAGATALAVRKDYFDTVSANRTFDALPAGVNGDTILLTFDVTGATRSLNFHTNSTVYRVGESGTLAAAVDFPVGNHSLKLTKEDAKWWLTDSGSVTASVTDTDVALTDAAGIFSATNVGTALLEASKVVTKSTAASYTIGTTNSRELYGGVIYVTGAATITIPAVADGASFTVITIGAVAVSVDPNAADLIMLDGTALADGDKVTNTSTAGDIAVFTYYDATGWYCASNTWTDGN